MKLKIYQNTSIGDEWCPVCGEEFSAPFSLTACSNCGLISMGCNMCPLDYNSQSHPDLKANCGGKACPLYHPVENLYAIFDQAEFDSLPEDYRGEVSAKSDSYMNLLLQDRIVPVYTTRDIVGITTIDMDEWRKGNRKLTGVPTILNIIGDELL